MRRNKNKRKMDKENKETIFGVILDVFLNTIGWVIKFIKHIIS